MIMGDEVCSPQLSTRLKELGVEQKSHFYWVEDIVEGAGWILLCVGDEVNYLRNKQDYVPDSEASAFTVAELGEIIPEGYWTLKQNGRWVPFSHMDKFVDRIRDSEADARAEILIYLLENKLKEKNT
jgi:hypothetical protein